MILYCHKQQTFATIQPMAINAVQAIFKWYRYLNAIHYLNYMHLSCRFLCSDRISRSFSIVAWTRTVRIFKISKELGPRHWQRRAGVAGLANCRPANWSRVRSLALGQSQGSSAVLSIRRILMNTSDSCPVNHQDIQSSIVTSFCISHFMKHDKLANIYANHHNWHSMCDVDPCGVT